MASQFALYRLAHILAYLQDVAAHCSGVQLFDVTDAAVIVNARVSEIELQRCYEEAL